LNQRGESRSHFSACFWVEGEGDQAAGAGSEYLVGSALQGMKMFLKRPTPSPEASQCLCHQSPANSAVAS
jgi:hypothetical protein